MSEPENIEQTLICSNKDDLINEDPNPSSFKIDKYKRKYSSMTYLTTKADDVSDKCNSNNNNINFLSRGFISNLDPNQNNVHSYDDLLFEELKIKGVIDSELKDKIDTFRLNLLKNSKNISNSKEDLALKVEFEMLKSCLDMTLSQLSTMQSILTMKDKKLVILEDALSKLMMKQSKDEKSVIINNFKRKTQSLNLKNVPQLLYDYKNEINISYNHLNEFEALKKEIDKLNKEHEKECKTFEDTLNRKATLEIKNEKIKFEEKLRELNSDNCHLLNNLQIELDFLESKSEEKEKNVILVKSHKEEVEYQNLNFHERRRCLKEKISYYIYIISSNQNYSLSYHNNVTVISDEESKTINSQTNLKSENESAIQIEFSLNDYDYDNKFISKSLNLQQKGKQTKNEIYSNDMTYNSIKNPYDITKMNSLNIKTMQVNYELDNTEMRPYPLVSKSSDKKISFPGTNRGEKQSKQFGRMMTGKVNFNHEDYMSNSILSEANPIRTFNSKFLNK